MLLVNLKAQHPHKLDVAGKCNHAEDYALQHVLLVQVEVQPSAASNPGIPPSSLSSFLRVKPSLPGVVLAEHSGPFTNPYYQSRLDTVNNVEPTSLAAAAVILATALHELASGPNTPQLQVQV